MHLNFETDDNGWYYEGFNRRFHWKQSFDQKITWLKLKGLDYKNFGEKCDSDWTGDFDFKNRLWM